MKLLDFLRVSKSNNKYDVAIRMGYLIFFTIGAIVFFSIGLQYMEPRIWLLTFVCCAIGATGYGTVVRIAITMIRKDLQDGKKIKAELILKLLYIVFFSLATILFIAIGLEKGTAKAWLTAFVGTFGGAVIYSAIARVIVTFIRKDK